MFTRLLSLWTSFVLFVTSLFPWFFGSANRSEAPVGEIRPDTWAAVDGLGRTLPMAGEVRARDVRFNFKLSDNMQTDGDVMDFYQNGDVAPGGRFTFVY